MTRLGALAPFAALAVYGLVALFGWWNGHAGLVQPRPADPPLPANAALCLLLLGSAGLAPAFGWRRTATAVAAAAGLLAAATLAQNLAGVAPGLDDLLATHQALVDGRGVGRIPLALGGVLLASAILLAWVAGRPDANSPRRPLLLALAASLAAAYALTALLAGRTGLSVQPAWQEHARLGAPGAVALLVLAGGLFVVAARVRPSGAPAGTWLWLPVVAGSVTATLLFWFALRERELAYLDGTTRLTIDNLATLYAAECRAKIDSLRRMAARWTQADGTPEEDWQRDAFAQFNDFEAYRALLWVDPAARTRWLHPAAGNEDHASLDHTADPLRAAALREARSTGQPVVAGPLLTPLRSPCFAIYVPLERAGAADGFLVAEIYYDRLLKLVIARLDLAPRYSVRVAAAPGPAGPAERRVVHESGAAGLAAAGQHAQTALYSLAGQRLSITLAPRAGAVGVPARLALPELALVSGMGVSLLLGLVVNLAQTAHFRRRAAERTSAELRAENEARRRSEEALRTSQVATRMLSHVARRTENPVVITAAAGIIEWANASFSRLTGRTDAEVRGRTPLLSLLASPDSDPQALERVAAALRQGDSIITDVAALSRDEARRYHLHLELQPVRNEAGGIDNFIALATDLTARVETEHELRRAKAEADAASRAKSDFLASMSHEIRTPMNGVIGMTSLLLETELTPEQRDYVGTIRTSGDALLAIINEILDFSKIESGKMELERQPFELAQCLEEALEIFAQPAAAKGIELAYYVDPAVPPWVEGDMTRLRQVLVNLINNAVKFTPEGSITVEVHVPAAATSPGVSPAGAADRRQLLDFFVTDTGIGIPPAQHHLLFQPFSQVDSSTTRRFGGTGLGLVICDRLCHLMGGSIDVTSLPGDGSTFRFSIQVQPIAAVVEEVLPPIPDRLHGRPVLIFDDHAINRAVLGRAASTLGFTPVETAEPSVVPTLGGQHPLAAAIIDDDWVHGERGPRLVQQLRALHPLLPVVLYVSPTESARREENPDRLLARLTKPIKPTLLRQVLARLFREAPATEPRPAPASAADGAPRLAASIPLDILLVEDNQVNQKVALRFLDRLGYRADAVGNGLEAVRTLEQRDYDLVFMDVQMPEMDGFTATREIRAKLPRDRQPRIIALTANAVRGDRERCLEAGMDDYLSKPVKLEALEQVILKNFGSAS